MPAIIGDPPSLEGAVLEAMICTQYWLNGQLEDPANVIYFRINDRWYRLYFDFGTVFWGSDVDHVPAYPNEPSTDEPFVNFDLGRQLAVIGRTVSSCVTESIEEHDSRVTFNFLGGGAIWFTCIGDVTSVEHAGLCSQ